MVGRALAALAWLVVAVLLGAAVYDAAVAAGTKVLDGDPAARLGGAALVVGMLVAAGTFALAAQPRVSVALLAPAGAAFVGAFLATYDSYYLPLRQRYVEQVSDVWLGALAALSLASAALVWRYPRAGAVATAAALILWLMTAVTAGSH